MDAHLIAIFTTVALAHFLALLSPGPDFVLIVKSATQNKRSIALGVAGGIATANALYIALCLIGVGAILASSIIIMTAIKLAGGLFLIYVAYSALSAKKSSYAFVSNSINSTDRKTTFSREFVTGFLSGVLNPKNPLFYLSLFTLVLNNEIGTMFKIMLGIWMVSIVFIWDSFIIFVLSREKTRLAFNRAAFYIDKFSGLILGAFGLTLIYSSIFEEKR